MRRRDADDPLEGEELAEAIEQAHRTLFHGEPQPPKRPEPSEDDIAEASRLLFDEGRRLEDVAGGGR